MTPYAIYIEERAVSVQWDPRGPFVTLHESGDITTQFREPSGVRWEIPDRWHSKIRDAS